MTGSPPQVPASIAEPLAAALAAAWSHAAGPTIAHAQVLAEARASIALELARITDHTWLRDCHTRFGRGCPSDFAPRIIGPAHAPTLCALRFFACDPSRPFIDVIASAATAADAPEAVAAALHTFAHLGVRCARVFTPGLQPPLSPRGWRALQDQVLVTGSLAQTARSGPDAAPPPMLEPAETDHAMAFMANAYEAFAARDPDLARRVPASTRAQLEDCARSGILAWWLVDRQRAGLIGAARSSLCGLRGFLMVEEVVAPPFVGRGSAAVAQRSLAAALAPANRDAHLFGTIDAGNIPSRRTAARAARSEIAAWWFLEVPARR